MRQIISADRGQQLLLPPSLDEWVGEDASARFIAAFVENLELSGLGLDSVNRHEGGVAFAPALLLGVWLYGYHRKIRSVRGLETACRCDLGFLWMTGNEHPDHNALWRYWSAHHRAIKNLFKETVRLAYRLGYVGFETQALDGTKIQARCSGHGLFDEKQQGLRLERLDKQIEELERAIESSAGEPSAAMPAQLAQKKNLREKIRGAMEQMRREGRKEVPHHEPDAQRLKTDAGNKLGHNAQVIADAKSAIITCCDMTGEANDRHELARMVAKADGERRELLGEEGVSEETMAQTPPPLTQADAGYATIGQLQKARELGLPVQTPPPPSWNGAREDRFHTAHFVYDQTRDIVRCPGGSELRPMPMTRERAGRTVRFFKNKAACRQCPLREPCAGKAKHRCIEVCGMRKQLEELSRRWRQHEAFRREYQQRAKIIEPRFGQMKQQHGFRRWSCFGREKALGQLGLLCATLNLNEIMRRLREEAARLGQNALELLGAHLRHRPAA